MSTTDNAGRFTGLADIYAAHRPTYPASVMAALAERATASDTPKTAIDIGCGTGISTLALAAALPDWRIIAAEPNSDMLTKAKSTCAAQSNIEFVQASADALPPEDATAGLVLAAQARLRYRTRFRRVLPLDT
jgi:ubiquinone/menaquinone biosynthesis C-methylase UbiE